MISVIHKQELENLVAMMIEEGDDAADIIALVKDAIIETEKLDHPCSGEGCLTCRDYQNKQEGIEIGLRAGREIAAREIFTELKKYISTSKVYLPGDGFMVWEYKPLSQIIHELEDAYYGVTE